jgi:hypothetical protein
VINSLRLRLRVRTILQKFAFSRGTSLVYEEEENEIQ